jgi:hypothetical protein
MKTNSTDTNKTGTTTATATEAWWTRLPAGEKEFIRDVMRMIKDARRSHSLEFAHAARRWETSFIWFIKMRLMNCHPLRRPAPLAPCPVKLGAQLAQIREDSRARSFSPSPRSPRLRVRNSALLPSAISE